MDPEFAKLSESLMPLYEALRTMSPVNNIPRIQKIRGVYLFTERDEHLYVGRSNNIRRRSKVHFSPGLRINDAPFAVLLARAEGGKHREPKLAKHSAAVTASRRRSPG